MLYFFEFYEISTVIHNNAFQGSLLLSNHKANHVLAKTLILETTNTLAIERIFYGLTAALNPRKMFTTKKEKLVDLLAPGW